MSVNFSKNFFQNNWTNCKNLSSKERLMTVKLISDRRNVFKSKIHVFLPK